jgi:hypothetical protein
MKRFIMMACFGLVLFGGVFATEARAGTCTVNALTDTGAGSGGVNGAGDLRYCIEQAEFAGGDNVINVIVTGTLMLNSPLVITHHPYNSSPATLIINGSGQSSFFIDGSNITPMSNGLAAAFRIATPAPLNVTINNLTVQNCNSHAGGGAMSIYGYSVSAYLNYVTIANNTLATGGGGAIQAYNSNLYISNSRITGNRTNYGGGGGIHISTQYIPNGNGRRLHITDSTISGNSASHEYDGGGGISSTVDNTEIQNSTISGNNAISGGGIYLTSINAKFSNVTISDNSGGGIYHNYRYARLTLRNCTIAGNTWTSYGAGIRTEGARTVLANTIIAYNSGRSYDGNPEQEYPVDSPPEVHGTNIFTTPFNRFIGGPGTILIADPLLNPLADNGGLTQTRSLRPGSPAIDTGLNSVALYPNGTPLQTDQRGEGFARIWGASVDVGAFEKGVISFSPDTLPPGSQNVPYSQQITAVGESAPFTLSVESGSLPTGFTLSSGGLLSGTTAQRGTFSFAVRATDTTGYFVVKNYVLYIGHIVTNANSSGAGSLRQLINDTPAGGTILFDTTFFNQPRTIPLNDGVLNIFKNLTITGPGANLLTLDGVNSTRVFGIDGGVTLNLSGVRITRGYNDHCGGGIINNGGSTLNAANIIIDNSRSDNGGGGICNVGTLNLTGSLITGNTAANEGGGIRNNPGNTVNITNSTLSNNQASNWNGGGVSNNGTLNVFGSTLSGNTSPNGGGVYAGGISIINNSTLSGNAAISGAGGAAYISSGSRLDTTNTTITNNVSSSNQIGGIFNQGLYQTRNSIIAGNRNANGTGNGDLNGDIASYGWNLFGNTFGTSIGSSGTGGQTLTGNLYNVAANLAPLGNYGGATETHALLSNSPAINAGDPNGSFTTDQRGSPRPIGGRGDIGSFERDITFEQNNLPAAVLGRNYNETLTVSRQANLSIAALFLRQSDTARLSARSVDSGKTASPQDDPLARVLPGAMNKLSFTTASSDPLLGVLQPNSNLTALFNFSIITINGQGLPPGLSLSSNGLISGLPTASGNYAFTIKATDADGMAGVQTFAILVNTAPTISDIADQTIFSSAPTSALAFTVSDPETPVTSLTVSGTSSNQTLIPNSNIVFGGADTNRTVTITPAANQIGSATITVTVTDSGGASTSVSFALTVLNRLPTISAIPDQTTDEDTPTGALAFTVGDAETSAGSLVVTTTSSNQALVPNSGITLAGAGGANRTIQLMPSADQNGTTTITLTVTDANGAMAQGVFDLAVNPANDAPTFAKGAGQIIDEDAGARTVNNWATNISAGPPDEAGQTLAFSLSIAGTTGGLTFSSAPAISAATGALSYTSAPDSNGTATISVTLSDNGSNTPPQQNTSAAQTFTITVNPVNDAPTLDPIADPAAILEDTGAQTINLSGISAGGGESQTLTVTATSNNTALIPNPTVNYTSPNATGSLSYTPVADANGSAVITVTVTDDSGETNNSFSRQFTVNVTAANDAPTFAKGAGQIIDEDAGARTVNNWATNISAGPPDEAGQTLAFSLSIAGTTGGLTFSSAPAISAATGALSYTSAPDSNGTATISVTLSDNGSNAPPQQNTSAAQTFTITVNPVNDAPTISGIADLVTNEGTPIAPIAFTVGDVETLAVDLSLSGSSSNQTLVPNANIAFGGTGASRTITISPVAGQIGTTTITVTVTDADGGTASKSFALTVQLPVILVTNGNDAGTGSLRQAIVDVSDGGTINFAPNVNLITLTSGQIQLGRSVTINGPGANQLTVSGNHTSRVFEVSVDAPAVVTISGLTIANGNVAGWMDEGGGGILKNNDGTLNIVDCAFTNNFSPYIGGGISVTHYHPGSGGAVNITGSTFSGNSTGAYGGAIYLLRGSLTVASSTISGNSSGEYGGGISTGDYGNFFADNGRISLANSTVTNNSAYYCGGIVNPAQREFNLRNNIIAQNNGTEWAPDLCESYRTQGYNLIGSSQGAYFTGPTNLDLRNQNSRLAPLGNNGGATQTHALLADSPALDAGNDCVLTANGCGDNNPALTTDQRGPGFPRQAGTAVDIGAFEAIAYSVSATAGTPQTALLNHAFATPLQATVTASGAPQSGVEVTFTAPASGASATFAGGSHTSTVTTDSQGVATAPTLTANSTAGSYQVTASANEHSATFSLTNAAGDQTITFDPLPNRTYGDEPFTLNAAASSGLPVSFSASGQCSLSGTTVQLTGAGACAITASQSGNDNYQAAPNVERTFSIGKANSTTIITVSDATYNGNPQGGTATVTGVGGLNQSLTVTYTGRNTTTYGPTTTVPANAGEYTASASYEGDDDHHGSGDSQPFTIARATATITLGNLTRTYDGAGQTVTATTDPAGLNVSLTYSQSSQPVATPTNAGSYVVTGQINEANYEGGMTGTFVINKATPVITWSSPSDITQGTALSSAQLNATANVPGEFAYTPPASTVLNAGHSQTLSATFTPTDTTNYDPAFAEVSINVLTAPGAIAGQVTHDGAPIAGLTVALSGTAPAVTTTDAFGTYSFANLAIGDYTVNVAAHPHYNFTPASRAFNLTSGQTISDAHFAALSTLSNPQPAGGSVLISEFRPAGETEDDEFIELYNNSDSAVDISNYTVAISGYLLGIPAGTILPARTHYLIAHASGYSLTGVVPADQTYDGFELPTEAGLALVAPGGVIMDAAGFTSAPASCREGEGIAAPALSQGQYSFARRYRHGLTQDTGDNAADFMLVSTDPAATGGSLGSPGPESTTSHIQKNLAEIVSQLIDPGVSPSTSPNRTRDAGAYADVQTPSAPGGGAPASNPYALGTLSIQRRFINNTERSVTRLRFRVVDITTAPDGVGTVADVRLLTSDGVTRAPAAVPAGVLLSGARLEQPPAQRFGGGYNSSVTVDLSATPNGRLLPGEWVDVQFLLGVAKGGTFRFFVVIEAVQSQ